MKKKIIFLNNRCSAWCAAQVGLTANNGISAGVFQEHASGPAYKRISRMHFHRDADVTRVIRIPLLILYIPYPLDFLEPL
jgi:hypothetical protein